MSILRISLLILLSSHVLVCIGCTHKRWAEQWKDLPGKWREKDLSDASAAGKDPYLFVTGSWGYRFGQIQGSGVWDIDVGHILIAPTSTVEQVACQMDRDECSGVYFKIDPENVRILLTFTRRAYPEMTYYGLRLINSAGELVAILPKAQIAYDLDNGRPFNIPLHTAEKLCVSAEQRVLAMREIRRVSKDFAEGRFNEKTVARLQAGLAAQLAINAPLCRDSGPRSKDKH
jgi:hypothetical protein